MACGKPERKEASCSPRLPLSMISSRAQPTHTPTTPTTPSSQPSHVPVTVAPYLTHMIAHHGQLTLVPPQNAGHIRKAPAGGKKKRAERTKGEREREGARERERERDEEPRFTTAVPPSSSRKLQPARSRKLLQTASQPPREHHPLLDVLDTPIPDYPPPSFLEAISAPAPYALAPPGASQPLSVNTALSTDTVTTPASSGTPQVASSPVTPHTTSPLVSMLTRSRSSSSSSSVSSVELVSLEPSQQWEADRTRGLPLTERVTRELVRQQAATSSLTLALGTPHPSTQPSPPTTPTHSHRPHRCSHCGSVRPLDCADEHDPDVELFDSDERGHETVSLHGSPRSLFPRRKNTPRRTLAISSPSPASAPSSPMSPTSPASSMSSPWASNVTLSLSNVFSHAHKPSASSLPPTLRHKESVGLRRLFAKGKDRDKAHEPPSPASQLLEDWEVLDPTASSDEHPTRDTRTVSPTTTMRPRPALPAFINRPLRRGPGQVSPFPPGGPSLTSGPSPLCEKSPLSLTQKSSAGSCPLVYTYPDSAVLSPHSPLAAPPDADSKKPRRRAPPPPPKPKSIARLEPERHGQHKPASVVWTAHTEISGPDEASGPSPPPPKHVAYVHAPASSETSSDLGVDIPSCMASPASDRSVSGVDTTATANAIGPPLSAPRSVPRAVPAPSVSHTLAPTPSTLSLVPVLVPDQAQGHAQGAYPPTPTTPTSGHHYLGRPLPQPPQSSPGSPVTAAMVISEKERVINGEGQIQIAMASPAHSNVSVSNGETTARRRDENEGGGHVHADTGHTSGGPSAFAQMTDLDVFVARLGDGNEHGQNYEAFLTLSDVLGPAIPHSSSVPHASSADATPFVGLVEMTQRRVLRDGRIKVRLTLLGAAVDKCAICMRQFKDHEMGALGPICGHA
ncbi:hypothetical protein AcW1_009809 [Taiwanofungus camphoratus]|nr:hypothetical protein AcV7_002399 [Antrodia cinnamomea]KAI0948248.1 hypothetical protein AcW1_009809 [Antrodia cinnamomea]